MVDTLLMRSLIAKFASWGLLAFLCLAAFPAAAQDGGQVSHQTAYSYGDGSGGQRLGGLTVSSQFVDPRGTVMGCDGLPLPAYAGFQIGLYEPDPADPTETEIKAVVALTPTGLPGQTAGIAPNAGNVNPFPMTDADKGRYSLRLDPARGQLDPGRVYILVLTPPPGAIYRQRRIRITIGTRIGMAVSYTATSLDGAPVSGLTGEMSGTHFLLAADAPNGGPALCALSFGLTDGPAQAVHLSKTGDRATAEPGDTVVYRITVSNTTSLPLGSIQISDTLPRGFLLREDSVRGAVAAARVPLTPSRRGPVTVFDAGPLTLAPGQTLTLAYAVLLTPDALRGDGKNSAVISASALLTLNGAVTASPVSDGPAVFTLSVRQGILSDSGTIVGRVWVDRNRDGEQQNGEPGVPGAVVLLDDSTRIVADLHGLFSLAAVPAGYHAAVLDMQSVPGFTLARSRFLERRSQSRLVRITPGGMARLNFGVVPANFQPTDSGKGRTP